MNNRETTKPVIITRKFDGRIDSDGTPDGVLVRSYDCNVLLTLEDANGGQIMTHDEAVGKYGGFLPSRKQAALICMYIDEVNAALKEAGGQPLDSAYWTADNDKFYTTWVFFHDGSIHPFGHDHEFHVRPVIQF